MSQINKLIATGLLATTAGALPLAQSLNERASNDTGMVYSFGEVSSCFGRSTLDAIYDRFQCANLEVPLDYEEPNVGTTHVAFIRQDSANGTGQDILFNPGGPGGSGILSILSGIGDEIIDLSGGKLNVIGFDPRGVNNSGIALTCFPGHPEAREAYYASLSSPSSLTEGYAQAVALGRFCTKANNDTTAKYAGTSAVVQDMMHFTELQAALNGVEMPEEAQIWYYGVSYGTVIGQTLAALYPDRVGRIIIDANVNGEDYYNGLTMKSVETSDDGIEWFFSLCAEAGPEKCLFAANSSSGSEVKTRFDDLLAKLEKTPVISSDLEIGAPVVITKKRVLGLAFSALYAPTSYFSVLAYGLDALERNNATGWLLAESIVNALSDPGPFNYTSAASSEAQNFITALDAADRYPSKDVDDYMQVAKEIEEASTYFGRGYADTNVLINSGLKITPPESQLFTGFTKTNTSNPMLFVNTIADPITPLSGAKHMSQYFEGSAVLAQNSGGHGFAAVRSKCTIGHVLAYLADATLPKEGTVCEIDLKPLVDGGEKASERCLW